MIYTPSEMATLRRSAAQWRGTKVPLTVGGKLRACLERFSVLRDSHGRVAGFGHEGFTLTPQGASLWGWGEELQRQRQINWR
jgi:hypothetical protein